MRDAAAVLPGGSTFGRAFLGLAPLILLGLVILTFVRSGPAGVFRKAFPPVEDLSIERITMPAAGQIEVVVVNGGPAPVTVAQVLVDDAAWAHTLDGDRSIGRLQTRRITIPYPWVEGEPHTVKLLTSTGLTFEGTVEVATLTPRPDATFITTFALLGIYVGVIPVFLGLLWLPFLRGVRPGTLDFFLSLTVGLLVFLGVDALAEALGASARVADGFHGIGLVLLGLAGAPLVITLVSSRRASEPRSAGTRMSGLIAGAIGLHNLGEGLAVGAAYSTGAISLGTFLVLGFLSHNTTEGLGIVSPLAREPVSLRRLIALGTIAGAPTILGAWIGGFSYSPILTTFFFAIGAGAIAQVVMVLWSRLGRSTGSTGLAPANAMGLLLGMAIMYVTSLLVTA
jgi:zinc transporter, ZIP family